jgi:signal peptidase I
MESEAVQDPPQNSNWLRFVIGKNPFWTGVRVLIFICLALVLTKFVFLPIRVSGDSMVPTYHDGQIEFVNRLAYVWHKPKRGDIVAVKYSGPRVLLLKRIIGLPGETCQVINGDFYINGRKLVEPYAFGKISGLFGKGIGSSAPHKLEWNQYFVLGDNRRISDGYIKYAHEIVGKVF